MGYSILVDKSKVSALKAAAKPFDPAEHGCNEIRGNVFDPMDIEHKTPIGSFVTTIKKDGKGHIVKDTVTKYGDGKVKNETHKIEIFNLGNKNPIEETFVSRRGNEEIHHVMHFNTINGFPDNTHVTTEAFITKTYDSQNHLEGEQIQAYRYHNNDNAVGYGFSHALNGKGVQVDSPNDFPYTVVNGNLVRLKKPDQREESLLAATIKEAERLK